jgi:hypothetical protein
MGAVCAFYADGALTFSYDRMIAFGIAPKRINVPPGAAEEFRLR